MNSPINESNQSIPKNVEKVYIEIMDGSEELSGSEHDILIRNDITAKHKSFFIRKTQSFTIGHYILFYGCIQGYMEQLFPANYSLFESLLSMNPVTIGTAAFLQKFMFTVASPFWGMIIDHSDPIYIMRFSIISLTISSLLICFSQTINQFFFSMCFWGFFSAVLGPLSQKIASDKILDGGRGKYFGKLMFFQTIGRQCALLFTGYISSKYKLETTSHLGIWMFPFLLSSLSGIFLFMLLKFFLSNNKDSQPNHLHLSIRFNGISSITSLGYVFKSKIVISLFILGMVNAIPRSALNFVPMWLQSTGLSQLSASFIVSISWVAAMFVSPIVGFVSDFFYNISPSKGRIFMAQLSLIFRSIFLYCLISKVPKMVTFFESEQSKVVIYSIISFIIGLFAGWPGIGACRPILCEVILPQHRATVFAFSSTFEGIGAAFFGTRFVGDLAVTIFGYNSTNKQLSNSTSNYIALGNAILCMTIFPWIISILIFYFITKEGQKTLLKSKEKSSMDKIPDSQSFIEIKTV